jgi:hypothetical protein
MRSYRFQCFWLALPLLMAGTAPALAADTDPVATRPAAAQPYPTPAGEPGPLSEAFDAPMAPMVSPNDGKIHGMVSAGVGTSGYREGAVAVEGPLGDSGFFALAIDGAQIDSGRGGRDRASAPAN